MISNQVSNQVSDEVKAKIKAILNSKVASIESTKTVIETIAKEARSREEIDLTNQRKNYQRHLEPLMELGFIQFTIPSKPTSKNQKYMLTLKGMILKEILLKT